MPIYEYRCKACEKNFECLVFPNDTVACPDCSSTDVCRLMSTCGFVSKSSGGQTTRRAAADSSCGGCSATSCAGCGH